MQNSECHIFSQFANQIKVSLLSFKWCHICKKNVFVGWAAELSLWVTSMKNQWKSNVSAKQLILLLTLVLSFWYLNCSQVWCLNSSTGEHGPCYSISWCLLQTHHVGLIWIGQLSADVPQKQVTALFLVSPYIISKLKAKFHIIGDYNMPDTGCEAGVPRRWRYKKTVSSPCQNLGTVGSLLQICRQGLQDNMADSSVPRQYRTECTQPICGLKGLSRGLLQLPLTVGPICAGVSTMRIGTWTFGEICSVVSPDSAYCSWINMLITA